MEEERRSKKKYKYKNQPKQINLNPQEKKVVELYMTAKELDERWHEIRNRIDNRKEPIIVHVTDYGIKYVSYNAANVD